jgi:outer membrane protein assembly factor BamB
MRSLRNLCVILGVGLAGVSLAGRAADSPPSYFRSDAGIAVGSEALPDRLDAPGTLRWRVPLDPGHSTPILHRNNIFLTTYRPEARELAIVALEQSTGKTRWRTTIVPQQVEQTHPIGSPATATPAVEGDRIFAFFGSAGLFCFDLEGRQLWEQRLGPFRDEYGAGSSPIVVGGNVILNQDHDVDSFLAAYDCATGRQVWRTARPDAVRSYATPVGWTNDGRQEILVAGSLRLTAYDPAKGEPTWWIDGLARIVIPTPVIDGPEIYMASWAPGGDAGKRLVLDPWATALAKWDADHDGKLSNTEIDDKEVLDRFNRMDLDRDGKLNQAEWERHAEVFRRAQNSILALRPSGRGALNPNAVIWRHSRGIPYVATPVLDRGILWMVKEGGIVTKLNAQDGRLLQEERVPGFGNYFASPVAGDGKVYFASESGTVSVMASGPEWRVVSSRDFHEKIYATPVLNHGCLFLRTERALYCFQNSKP